MLLDGAVRRLRRDEQRPVRGRFEERGHEDRHIVGGVEGAVDVAMTGVDKGGSRPISTFHAVVSLDVDQLTLDDVDDHGAAVGVPGKLWPTGDGRLAASDP